MRLTGSRGYGRLGPTPTMPPGLVELMEGLAKDVLKNNPENIYEFCAGHMQKLLEIRDGPAPPGKQLSLDQKIANAQEKIRQRIRNQHFQCYIHTSEKSNKSHDLEDEPPVEEEQAPVESTLAKQAVVEVPNENTSAMQPAEKTAIENTPVTLPVIHGEKLVMANEVEIFQEPDVVITNNGTSADTAPHASGVQSNEVSQAGHELKEDDVVAKQQLEDSTEKEIEVVRDNVGVDTNDQSNNDFPRNVKDIDHTENRPEITLYNKSQLGDSKPTISETGNNSEEKNFLYEEALENELIEDELSEIPSSGSPLTNNNETELNAEENKSKLNEEALEKQLSQDELIKITSTMSPLTNNNTPGNNAEEKNSTLNENAIQKELTKDESVEIASTLPPLTNNNEHESNAEEKNSALDEKVIQKALTKDQSVEIASTLSPLTNNNEPETNAQEKKSNLNEKTIQKELIKDELVETASTLSTLTNNNEPDSNAEDNKSSLNEKALQKEVIKDELIEIASTLSPLTNNNETVLSHIDDIKTSENDVAEKERILVKKEFTDIRHEEILIENYANKVEDSISGVLEEQGIIKKDISADIQPEAEKLLAKKNNIEFKRSLEGITHASEEYIVEQDDKFPAHIEDLAATNLTIKQLETPHLTETAPEENVIVRSTDTEIPEISKPQFSDTDAKLNQVITVEMTEKATVDDSLKKYVDTHVVQNNQIDERKVDKELSNNNNKLPEQDRAYCGKLIVKDTEDIREDTSTLNKDDTLIESDETSENTVTSGMDLETAAITIQKVFRTFLFSKSRTSTLGDDTVNENSLDEEIEKKDKPEYILTSSSLNKERRTGISRMDTVLQTVNEEKSLSLSDDSSLSSAATTIQAHVRGFLVRNRLASNKTTSSSSLVNSDGQSNLSLDGDVNEPKKTILNIHIVPERGQFMSRDESFLTSIDLPLDNSPPSSINLHPLGYDKSAERRKQLKREDAVQSITPPSNNSGKLSEEIESGKDALNDSVDVDVKQEPESISVSGHDKPQDADSESCDTTLTISSAAETVVDADTYNPREVLSSPDHNVEADNKMTEVVTNSSSDEMDVVTPYPTIPEKMAKVASVESENNEKPKLVHSGEFHDIVVQTQVKRSESSVVREFKNVLVYFLLWDKT